MNTFGYKILVLLSLMALVLAGCAPAGVAANPGTPTPLPQPTPTDAAPGSGSDANVMTLDNNNQILTLHVGETFLLKLGEDYEWSPVIDDMNVISRVMYFAVIRGAQGMYSAHQPGTATLTATGDPLCRQSKPACMIPSIIYTLHIEVMP